MGWFGLGFSFGGLFTDFVGCCGLGFVWVGCGLVLKLVGLGL